MNTPLGRLMDACRTGDIQAATAAKQQGADINGILNIQLPGEQRSFNHVAIHTAAYYDQPLMIAFLLANGADIGMRAPDSGNTVLNTAAFRGSFNCLQALLVDTNQGLALIDLTSRWGDTPLIEAAWRGHIQCVRLLIQAGASRTARNNHGSTARDRALSAGHHDIAQLLQ